MKIYVATSTANIDAAEELINYIDKETTHTITFDWTGEVRKHGREQPSVTPDSVIEHAARCDAAGVALCDLFILLWHPEVYGAMVEFGMACQTKKLWVVSDKPAKFSVFFKMPGNHAHHLSLHDARRALANGHTWGLISEEDPKETEVCIDCGAQRDKDGMLFERAGITGGWPMGPLQCAWPTAGENIPQGSVVRG